ncbi:MAG TPA: DUF3987 domain-containing protein, partial [Ginsengibacter sp.]|nr:DUF3987 domain-containing protein [Ginsengibacter sp.]
YKSNDATIEKLGEMLRDNPAGFLMLRDELTGLLASWERSGHEGDRAFYLESWNGNVSFDTDRIGRGSIFIPNLCLSIFGGIQPDKLQALLELTANALANDGTIQRFQMLVYPDYQKWEYRDRIPNKDARDAIYDLFEKISEFDPVSFGAHPADEFNKFPYFKFSAEAQDVYVSWSTQLHIVKIPAEDNTLIAQHLTKYDKLFPAIALILHIVDCVGNGTRGPVSREAAVRAAAWCEYLESHARRCYGLLADRGLCAAQNLSQKILQGELEDGFTARDVQRRQWSRLDDKDVVQEALEWLVDHNWLRKRIGISGKQGGRPTDTYHINPKVLIKATVKVDGDISATG